MSHVDELLAALHMYSQLYRPQYGMIYSFIPADKTIAINVVNTALSGLAAKLQSMSLKQIKKYSRDTKPMFVAHLYKHN